MALFVNVWCSIPLQGLYGKPATKVQDGMDSEIEGGGRRQRTVLVVRWNNALPGIVRECLVKSDRAVGPDTVALRLECDSCLQCVNVSLKGLIVRWWRSKALSWRRPIAWRMKYQSTAWPGVLVSTLAFSVSRIRSEVERYCSFAHISPKAGVECKGGRLFQGRS